MIRFREFMEATDPVELAQRVARRYGKKEKYGKWLRAEKGEHIPLKTYRYKDAESVFNRYDRIRKKVTGSYSPEKGKEKEWKEKLNSMNSQERLPISSLHPTQPFVRTDNTDTLRSKIGNTNPDHIHTATHKGKTYVLDGHHAVMAAAMRGETHVNSNHVNLDNY